MIERIKAKLILVLLVVQAFLLRPFMPMIKRIKGIKRLIKGFKITGKIGKILISVTNMGLSAYQFYDGFLKDKLNKDDKVTSA